MKPLSPTTRVLYRCLQRVLTLDVTWLMLLDRPVAKTQSVAGDPGVTARLLSAGDVRQLASEADADLSPQLAHRLTSGVDYCVGLFVDGALASYAWFALESIEPAHNRGSHPASGVGFSFPPHMAFMYKGYTLPSFRGRGLYSKVQHAAFELLEDRGVRSILSTADWSNAAALTSCTRLGFEPIGRVWVGGVGNFVWRKRPASARAHGIAAFHGSRPAAPSLGDTKSFGANRVQCLPRA